MANPKKISALTAVVTPVGSDTLAAVQGSTTKKLTATQLLAVQATISQADAEAGTATDRKTWTAERVKQAIEALASGGTAWEVVTASDTIAAGEGFLVADAGNTVLITLEATIVANKEYVIHNDAGSTGTVSLEPNSGHTIVGPGGSVVGGTDTILIAPGETLRIVSISASALEIV